MDSQKSKKIISVFLISASLICLGIYLFQVGELAILGQKIQEQQAFYQELGKANPETTALSDNSSLLATEARALKSGFVKTEQIKYIPLLAEYLARGN